MCNGGAHLLTQCCSMRHMIYFRIFKRKERQMCLRCFIYPLRVSDMERDMMLRAGITAPTTLTTKLMEMTKQ